MKKDINVVGLSLSHCATACLLQNGRIIGAVSEERFNRKKNCFGYPKLSLDYLLETAGIEGKDLDLVVLYGFAPLAIDSEEKYDFIYQIYDGLACFFNRFPFLKLPYDLLYGLVRPGYTHRWRQAVAGRLQKELNLTREKIVCVDHHLCHAYAPLFGLLSAEQRKEKLLLFTNDGMGDDYCAAVNIFDKGRMNLVGRKTANDHSLALVYTAVTKYLGMKTLEHEYKVMGLAPYADKIGQRKSYEVLQKLVWLNDDLSFGSKIAAPSYYYWLKDNLHFHRFDWIAGAIQQLTEELLTQWIKRGIEKTGIKKIVLGGGIFMNVKANMLIAELPEVQKLFIMPSATDESTAIGAAFIGYQKKCQEEKIFFDPHPLANLYLGPDYTEAEINQVLKKSECFSKYLVSKVKNIEKKIAELLAEGKIVARFSGRMEWGARALGNRSILADPRKLQTIKVINEQIKGRDFWMPFAPTILYERQGEYLVNPQKMGAPFMVLAFETTPKGREVLQAAIHPYDFTCRPQILKKEQNPKYYEMIKEFEKLTGVGAVLNTSFNLHGDPIICSPKDAMETFEKSGLKYLAMEDYLISKK